MPLSAKKVAASYSTGGARIPRAPLVSCLTCPLCSNLFRDATTISECLHTFCRDCIHRRLSDGETNNCPMCNVSLGTLPLEKLRADHQLDDVKVKIFPDSSRKRKHGPGSSPAGISSGTPLRRRERSLYSLGIGAAAAQASSLANPGFATRTTRRSSGKSVAGRDSTSTSDDDDDDDELLEHDEHELNEEDDEEEEEEEEEADEMDGDEEDEGNDDDLETEELTEDDASPETNQGVLPDPAISPSPIAAASHTRVQSEFYDDSDDDDDDNNDDDDEELLPPPVRPSRAKEEPRRKRAPLRDSAAAAHATTTLLPPAVASYELGLYLAHRSILTANGFSSQSTNRSGNSISDSDHAVAAHASSYSAAGAVPQDTNDRNATATATATTSTSNADSLLATLAEVAGADVSSRANKLSNHHQHHHQHHAHAQQHHHHLHAHHQQQQQPRAATVPFGGHATASAAAAADVTTTTRLREANNNSNNIINGKTASLDSSRPPSLPLPPGHHPSASTAISSHAALADGGVNPALGRGSPPRARRSSPQQLQQKKNNSNNNASGSSLKLFVNGAVERPAILKHPNSSGGAQPQPQLHPAAGANGSHLAGATFGPGSCGIWFALQAARNQSDNPLPQLTSPYLRIKDGKLPVSHVKKYLVKKLGLNNETEVEITCRGQPVVSSLPLESVRNIWFATAVPDGNDQDEQGQAAGNDSSATGLVRLDASSAKELIMVLTYQRHRRNPRIC